MVTSKETSSGSAPMISGYGENREKSQRPFYRVKEIKVVRYSKGQKMSKITFDARSQQWLVQLPQKFMYFYLIIYFRQGIWPSVNRRLESTVPYILKVSLQGKEIRPTEQSPLFRGL